MADSLPKFIDGLSYTGLSLRRGDLTTVMHDGNGTGGRTGVRPGGTGLAVTLAGTTITVAAGVACLQYQPGQGVYRACLASSTALTLTAAHATLSRIDLVYLRVWDNLVDASGQNLADAVYLAGTPGASPSAPAPSASEIYIPLATITVPPSGGGAPTVSTAVRPYTVAPGGILPSSTAPDGPYVGQYYDDGTGLRRWNGSTWDTYLKAPTSFTSWTPVWSTTTGVHLPSYGNATVNCRYVKLGRLVTYTMLIVFGSTTNFGSGATTADNWQLSLPVAAAQASYPIGTATLDAGASRGLIALAQSSSDGTTLVLYPASGTVNASAVSSAVVDSVSPWTWASGSQLTVIGQYEAVS
ncbi:hypothetical protein [Streptomyces sp. NPDC006997]|uniref:hypothetical protein n=1 Tax=Streptomyces sp. NPDC006997 TaxID=3155356 RepID=UPI0033F6B80A